MDEAGGAHGLGGGEISNRLADSRSLADMKIAESIAGSRLERA